MSNPKVLFSNTLSLPTGERVETGLIEVSSIKVSPDNVRKLHLSVDMDLLGEDIQKIGQLSPLLLDEKYEVIGGQRKFLAMQKAGVPHAMFIKRDFDWLADNLDWDLLKGIPHEKKKKALKLKYSFSDNEFLLPLDAVDKERLVSEIMKETGINTLEKASELLSRPVQTVAGWTRGKLGQEIPKEILKELPPNPEESLTHRQRVAVRTILKAKTLSSEEKKEFAKEIRRIPTEALEKAADHVKSGVPIQAKSLVNSEPQKSKTFDVVFPFGDYVDLMSACKKRGVFRDSILLEAWRKYYAS